MEGGLTRTGSASWAYLAVCWATYIAGDVVEIMPADGISPSPETHDCAPPEFTKFQDDLPPSSREVRGCSSLLLALQAAIRPAPSPSKHIAPHPRVPIEHSVLSGQWGQATIFLLVLVSSGRTTRQRPVPAIGHVKRGT